MINREAQELVEALRLQKLRAAEYLLDHIEKCNENDFAVAIEFTEDVYVKNSEKEKFEQDKNYDKVSTFSLNSEEVLKSLCSFLDIWVDNQLSSEVSFCFLSTNQIAKEYASTRSKKLKITFPAEKIIEELKSGNQARISTIIEVVKKIVIDFYEDNYSSEVEMISSLKGLSDELWVNFFQQIVWLFDFPPIADLEIVICDKIKNSRFFSSYSNKDSENSVKASLLDLIEIKSSKKSKVFRLVTASDIKLLFLIQGNESNSNLESDDVHKLWEQIEKPTDFRNVTEKILAVSPNFSKRKLETYERKAAIAKVGEESLKNNPAYLSLKYRVYDFCENQLGTITSNQTEPTFSEAELVKIIDEINADCVAEFNELKKQYSYGIDRSSIIMELFIEFIDSCYLAFD